MQNIHCGEVMISVYLVNYLAKANSEHIFYCCLIHEDGISNEGSKTESISVVMCLKEEKGRTKGWPFITQR
jgi:hypothetical protein